MCIPTETTEASSPLHSKNITQKKENVDKNRKKTKGEKFYTEYYDYYMLDTQKNVVELVDGEGNLVVKCI